MVVGADATSEFSNWVSFVFFFFCERSLFFGGFEGKSQKDTQLIFAGAVSALKTKKAKNTSHPNQLIRMAQRIQADGSSETQRKIVDSWVFFTGKNLFFSFLDVRNPEKPNGMIRFPCKYQQIYWCQPWLQGGAGFPPSTV